jgi:hypothetical protein
MGDCGSQESHFHPSSLRQMLFSPLTPNPL